MPIITVESKRLIEVRTPPHALRAPAPLHPSAPLRLRTPSAPLCAPPRPCAPLPKP